MSYGPGNIPFFTATSPQRLDLLVPAPPKIHNMSCLLDVEMPPQSSITLPTVLPDDVLRQLLQGAARADRTTALCLALLSRSIQHWIEEIIYEEVVLSRESTAHAFLRTIQTSKSKTHDFFAFHVKSLFICPDLDPMDVVTLLSSCRGIKNLSYWPLVHTSGGSSSSSSGYSGTPLRPDPWQRRTPSPPLYHTLGHRRETRAKISKFVTSVALHNIEHIAPRRVSLLLSETHPIHIFHPTFQTPFFASVTHLTISNRWEEWTSWAGGAITSFSMPHLTHVKLDLAVGQAPPEDVSRSRARWLNTVTDGWSSTEESCPSDEEKEALTAWTRKINRVASTLSDILDHTQFLSVLILVLRFDSNPTRTAKQISRLLSARSNDSHMSGTFASIDALGSPEPGPGFDSRLVFAWEKEPFRYCHAHSAYEKKMWHAAETVTNSQRFMSGYNILNCDYLS
ncbi:hypothetical protein BDN70DRAFT_929682 [Pholiota conissans]|uniref:Uncharacterized protein n=1 Tax=Pholiota conissans TaxID=109636 RepID=A0A9P5Z772_9AGAR|nr:hypothetical protein BDN70DRAFT_929682 [Pholiota conissans]